MINNPISHREKTDLELIAMVRELALQIERIGDEQRRRTGLTNRENRAARNAEENEGGISDSKLS
jgi:hypothetical protein